MKTIKHLLASSLVLYLVACTKPDPNSLQIKKVSVNSIDFDGLSIKNLEGFNVKSTGLGYVDSTDCRPFNAFMDQDNNVYAFEGKEFSEEISKLSLKEVAIKFLEADWQDAGEFSTPTDVSFCEVENIFTIRPNGTIKRQVAEFGNLKVYKFKNEMVVGNYAPYIGFQNFRHKDSTSPTIDIFKALDLDPKQFKLEVSRPDLKVGENGIIDLANSTVTPEKTIDKIILRPISKGTTYEFRVLFVEHSKEILSKFFPKVSEVPDSLRRDWATYLTDLEKSKYLPMLNLDIDCKCQKAPQPKMMSFGGPPPPPPPILVNGD